MEITISVDDLKTRPLFLATPMYGGMCSGTYAKSLAELSGAFATYGLPLQQYFLFNESLITRARNYSVDEFLRSECTHMIFIDSDIGFSAQDVITLLALCTDESNYDVICGPYPKKTIAWEKIKHAVDKGVADNDPNILDRFVGDYVFNPVGGGSFSLNEPVEVLEAGTGFMMIRRSTLLKYREAYPETAYLPDHVRTANFDGSREIHAFFDCKIDPVSRRYLSEDYLFCQNVRKMGGHVWLCPWMQLQHYGSFNFGGSLGDIASIGAVATADVSKVKAR